MLNTIKYIRQNNFDFFLIVFFITFLVIIFTGIQSDDFTAIYQAEKTTWKDFFT